MLESSRAPVSSMTSHIRGHLTHAAANERTQVSHFNIHSLRPLGKAPYGSVHLIFHDPFAQDGETANDVRRSATPAQRREKRGRGVPARRRRSRQESIEQVAQALQTLAAERSGQQRGPL